MNEQQAYIFVQFSDIVKNCIFAHLSSSIFLLPHPSIQKLLTNEESSEKDLNVCSNKHWIGGWGVYEIWEKSMLILLISAQTSYFCDNDTIYDVIVQEPFTKYRQYHRQRQTDRANFAIKSTCTIIMLTCDLFLLTCDSLMLTCNIIMLICFLIKLSVNTDILYWEKKSCVNTIEEVCYNSYYLSGSQIFTLSFQICMSPC